MPPEITVIIPVHNRAELLGPALATVEAQEGAPTYEVIVVDDLSSDASAQVARDAGVRVLQHETNQGPGSARNTGIWAAEGAWCAFLDSDDLWAPSHLRTLWRARGGVDLVSGCSLAIGAGGEARVYNSPFLWPITADRPAALMRPTNMVNTSATMARTSVLRQVGGFRPQRYAEDMDLWLRLAHGHRVRILPTITVGYRTHAGQVSAANRAAMRAGVLRSLASAEADMAMDDTARRKQDATSWWDDLRAAGRRPTVAGLLRYRLLVPKLLLGRLLVRHRWKLPGSGGRTVAAMLSGNEQA